MSVANSFQHIIKIPSSQSSSSCSSSTPNPCSSSSFRFSSTTAIVKPSFARSNTAIHVAIRNSQTEGPIRRPVAPPSIPINKPTPPSQSPPPPSPPSSVAAPPPPKPVMVDDKNAVTLEFQRLKAKELQEYFKLKKIEETNQGPAFGFVGKNEISNGRWAMFGFAVGLLTEYATGSDFVDQVKILLSNFGILDLE